MSSTAALTVSSFTRQVKNLLEDAFNDVKLIGELSNFKAHNSGHWYFSLKDSDAQISCVMWRTINGSVFFTPNDGMKIIVSGRLTVYPPRGNYQLDVRSMLPAGAGELQAAFEALKLRLDAEGLFDEAFKKTIPRMPMKIGIVTASDGAALQDMISAARRRFPVAELIIAPSKVQGAGAADSIADSIAALNRIEDIEVILLARGGGSIEDLWAFNEERTARAIFNSNIPVVTGVGHETDFTIADFVADMRATTPTAAMEAVTPDCNVIAGAINEEVEFMQNRVRGYISGYRDTIKQLVSYSLLKRPMQLVQQKSQTLDYVTYRLNENINCLLLKLKHRVQILGLRVERHNTANALKKGFVLVSQHGKFVKRGSELIEDDIFDLRFYDKTVKVNTNEKE